MLEKAETQWELLLWQPAMNLFTDIVPPSANSMKYKTILMTLSTSWCTNIWHFLVNLLKTNIQNNKLLKKMLTQKPFRNLPQASATHDKMATFLQLPQKLPQSFRKLPQHMRFCTLAKTTSKYFWALSFKLKLRGFLQCAIWLSSNSLRQKTISTLFDSFT